MRQADVRIRVLPERLRWPLSFQLRGFLVLLLAWQVTVHVCHAGQPEFSSISASSSKPMMQVEQVHGLTAEQAAAGLPVRIRGVVTVASAWRDSFFIQDRSGGIAVERLEHSPLHAGERVEITGVSEPGGFAPIIREQQVRVLGRAPMPPSRLYTYAEMAGGLKDSDWVAVEGVVESAHVRLYWSRMVLELRVGVAGGMITARILDYKPGDEAALVDAKIRLHGVCGAVFNDRRQLTGILLFLNSRRQLDVLQKAPEDPYAAPLSPSSSIMQFKPGDAKDHRIRVAGTLTYQDPGNSLYVQDGTGGLLVQSEQGTPVPLGTRIEVIGFPCFGGYAPMLRNALFRVARAGRPIQPTAITVDAFFQPQAKRANDSATLADAPYNSQLVRVQGTLLESTSRLNGRSWLLREGKNSFAVAMREASGTARAPFIENGSVVSATGVFVVQVDENNQPQTFRILLRGPADLQVLKPAPWWTLRHALAVLALLLLATLGAALWAELLRRQVRQQTLRLRESEDRFRTQAQQDSLTGLASRSFLQEQMHLAMERAAARGERLGVLMVDLDHFKQVNDTLGHHAGDELLCEVAKRIRASVRKSDLIARMGGDEFIVLLPDLDSPAEAELIGAKVVANVSLPLNLSGREIPVSASVGVCIYPDGGASGEALLKNVDAAMYKAKAAGRNSFTVYTAATHRLAADTLAWSETSSHTA